MFSRFVYWIVGILEALLAFRLVFKLLGANAESGFVATIYGISGPFVAPFSGIFRTAVNTGIETKSVLEPATIIAMLVYGLISYGIVRLLGISENPNRATRETIRETPKETTVETITETKRDKGIN